MLHAFSPKKTQNTSPGQSWTTLHCRNDRLGTRRDLGREHSILLSVTHMLCVSQDCHAASLCVKDSVVLRQAWSKSQWTALMGYITTSTNVRRYQTHHRWQFFFQEDNTQVHCVRNTIQLSEICNFRVSAFCQVCRRTSYLEVAY